MPRKELYMTQQFSNPMEDHRSTSQNTRHRQTRDESQDLSWCASKAIIKVVFAVSLFTSIAAGIALGILFYPSYSQVNTTADEVNLDVQADQSEEIELVFETTSSATTTSTTLSTSSVQKLTNHPNPSRDAITGNVVSLENRKWVGVNAHTCGTIDSGTPSTLQQRVNFRNLIEKLGHDVDPRDADFGRFARIVGGRGVSIKSHPWQVGLWTKVGHTCGGSLIASNWVLTAAHCTAVFTKPTDWRIFLGETNRLNMGSLISDDGLQFAEASDVITHAHFNSDNYDNDVALIRLKDHVVLTDYTNTICLPPPNVELVNGTKCLVSGWGVTSEGGQIPDFLREASVDIIDRSICNHPDWLMGMVTHLMLCAGTIDGSQDACQGDSGGPLVCFLPTTSDTFYLVGAVSWGIGCGVPSMPGVYTDLSLFRKWIDDVIRNTEIKYP